MKKVLYPQVLAIVIAIVALLLVAGSAAAHSNCPDTSCPVPNRMQVNGIVPPATGINFRNFTYTIDSGKKLLNLNAGASVPSGGTANQVLHGGATPAWGPVANADLTNSSVTINTTGPLAGGGVVALGGTLNLTCSACSAASAFSPLASDPVTPSANTVWYNTTNSTFRLFPGTGLFSITNSRLDLASDSTNTHRIQATILGSNAEGDIDVHGLPVLNIGVNSDPGTTINVGAAPTGVTTQTNINGNLLRLVSGNSGLDILASTGVDQYRPIAIWGTPGVKRLQLTEQSDQMFSFGGRLEGNFQMLGGFDHQFLLDASPAGRGGDIYVTPGNAAAGSAARGGVLFLNGGTRDGAGTPGQVVIGDAAQTGSVTIGNGSSTTTINGTLALGAFTTSGAVTFQNTVSFAGAGSIASSFNPNAASAYRIGSSSLPFLGLHLNSAEGLVVHGDLTNTAKLTCDYVTASGLARCTGDNRFAISAPTSVAVQATGAGGFVQLTPPTGGYSQAINSAGSAYGWRVEADGDVGFFNATPVAQPTPAAVLLGATVGAGPNVTTDTTFTGGIGASAYTIGDIVRALKQLGLLAQ